LEDFESKEAEFGSAGNFLLELRKEFGRGNKKSVKVAELQRIEQGERIIEKVFQKFQKAVRNSEYKERVLVEKFKRKLNRIIRKKLIETEISLTSIEQ